MIEQKQLKRLIKLMIENDLTELDLQDGDERICLKRGFGGQPQVHMTPVMPHTPAPAASGAPGAEPPETPADEAGLTPIKSPMVGTYYAAASPDTEPYVNVGTRITGESTVCIIEAMKVFNEIKAEVTGTIEKILVDNGQTVEFNQTLFLVKP